MAALVAGAQQSHHSPATTAKVHAHTSVVIAATSSPPPPFHSSTRPRPYTAQGSTLPHGPTLPDTNAAWRRPTHRRCRCRAYRASPPPPHAAPRRAMCRRAASPAGGRPFRKPEVGRQHAPHLPAAAGRARHGPGAVAGLALVPHGRGVHVAKVLEKGEALRHLVPGRGKAGRGTRVQGADSRGARMRDGVHADKIRAYVAVSCCGWAGGAATRLGNVGRNTCPPRLSEDALAQRRPASGGSAGTCRSDLKDATSLSSTVNTRKSTLR